MMHQELKKNHEWNMADTVTTVRMGASVFLRFVGVVYCCIQLVGMHFGICGISGGTGYTPFADRLPCKPKIYYFKKVNCEERFEQNENCNVEWTES